MQSKVESFPQNRGSPGYNKDHRLSGVYKLPFLLKNPKRIAHNNPCKTLNKEDTLLFGGLEQLIVKGTLLGELPKQGVELGGPWNLAVLGM